MNNMKVLLNGIIKENPTFVLLLGMCPTLGTTSSAINGMSMGLATMAVLIFSNLIISLIKNLIPDKVRIPSFIVVIASLVTILQMLIKAYAPCDADHVLGICGNQDDCVRIKTELRDFLFNEYKLELSEEKTKITHSAERIRFLGYDIAVRRSQEVKTRKDGVKQRTLNYSVELTVPLDDKIMKYLFDNGIIEQRPDGKIWPIRE